MTMIWHEEYRGFQIAFRSEDQVAWIKPATSEVPLTEKARGEAGGGRTELRSRAHSIIDNEISARDDRPADSAVG